MKKTMTFLLAVQLGAACAVAQQNLTMAEIEAADTASVEQLQEMVVRSVSAT